MNEASPTLSGCAACAVIPNARGVAEKAAGNTLMISVPSMHCAACISKIEKQLDADPRVISARVNLSLKRVMIEARSGFEASDFIPEIKSLGYEAYPLDQEMLGQSEDKTARAYLMRLGIAGFAMMNVMLLSISVWSGADESTRDLLHWVSALIAIPAVIYAAQPFFRSAWKALKHGTLNMDVPISLAIILALAMSVYETSQSGENAYFDAALSLTFFLLIGRYLDYRTRSIARSAAQELSAMETQKTTRIERDGDHIVPVAELAKGDVLRILPGARVPVDGEILTGQSDIDTSFISGESLPSVVGSGDKIRAGMLNLTGMLTMRAEAVGEETSLHQIAKLVAIAENGRNHYTSLADRAAKIYAPLVHVLALVSFVAWMAYAMDWHFAMNVAIAVLVITCPCALGLAVPAVNTAASGRLFQKGVLLKSETALERLADIDRVVFDKTGTLTEGQAALQSIEGDGDLGTALALAQSSAHPLARALAQALQAQGFQPKPISHPQEEAGLGVKAEQNGARVRLGRASWLSAPENGTGNEVWLEDEQGFTRFAFHDQTRVGVVDAVKAFQKRGIEVWLLSGDREAAVEDLASRIGVSNFRAQCLPEEKAALIEKWKREGHKTLMVGDGLNDTAALAAAHVSMAPGSAMDAARMASDIVLLGENVNTVYQSYLIATRSKKRIIENFAIAAVYNLIAIPFAMLGFVTPLIAALAMSTSSIIVVLNSNRIRWTE